MNDTTTVEPTTIPTMQSGGFSVPSVGPDGAPLSMRAQFDTLKTNPAFVQEALTPHSPAAAWVAKMNAEAAGVAPLAPPIGPGLSSLAPEAFTIAWPPGFEGSPEQSAADSMFRGWLVAAGVDRETGDSLASLAAERITHLEKSGDQSNAHVESERILRSVYGEQFQPRIDGAIRLVDHIENTQPGFAEFLQHTGLGNDATFVHRLAMIAEQRGI